VFAATASYGHFGRSEFSWESTKPAAELASLIGINASQVQPQVLA
jgi:S-adenosylmethionine synthetase